MKGSSFDLAQSQANQGRRRTRKRPYSPTYQEPLSMLPSVVRCQELVDEYQPRILDYQISNDNLELIIQSLRNSEDLYRRGINFFEKMKAMRFHERNYGPLPTISELKEDTETEILYSKNHLKGSTFDEIDRRHFKNENTSTIQTKETPVSWKSVESIEKDYQGKNQYSLRQTFHDTIKSPVRKVGRKDSHGRTDFQKVKGLLGKFDQQLIEQIESSVITQDLNVNFEDIAELDDAKEIIQESILLPLLIPEYFTGIRKPLRGVLLYGPPGTGKTMLAKAVATYGKTTFFNVNPSTLAGTWAGEFEKLVRYLFELARFYAPSTIFLDEIDAIGSRRSSKESDWVRKIKTELYIQMDGISKDIGSPQGNDVAMSIIVIGATNRPWDLDEALLRRLERRIYIPLPSPQARRELFSMSLKSVKLQQNINWDKIIETTEGYSGADIKCVCRESANAPMRKQIKLKGGIQWIFQMKSNPEALKKAFDIEIREDDLLDACKCVHKSVSNDYLDNYHTWMKAYGGQS